MSCITGNLFKALDLPEADYGLLLGELGTNGNVGITTSQRCDRSICGVVSHALKSGQSTGSVGTSDDIPAVAWEDFTWCPPVSP